MTLTKKKAAKSLVDKAEVTKAVQTLSEFFQKKVEDKSFLGELIQQKYLLQIVLKKIPSQKHVNFKINLPNSHHSDLSEVCLFVKDVDKASRDHEASSRHYKEVLLKNNIHNISQIVPLKELKLEYQPFEAKRNLSNLSDVFLADARIIRLLPKLLGKNFYGRNRIPLQIDLESKDLAKEVKTALHLSVCSINRGSTCTIPVGHTALKEDQLTENVMACIAQMTEKLPGGKDNIHSLHLKTNQSPAVALYLSYTSGEEVKLPKKKDVEVEVDEPEDVTTIKNKKVRVMPTGDIHLVEQNEDGEAKKTIVLSFPGKVKETVVMGDAAKVKRKRKGGEEVASSPAKKTKAVRQVRRRRRRR
ncbi:hypothetical protein CAPTEDRAFT_149919 [Capitella teleta]|uniref:Ribosomal L1 domain-containing protein 1 n=1 Tax=Capitella teleta TaxID=283909 RepID=R7T675_CAPTE|nr:hypothetical protein CAPTEDRAFT_149919 [Capitella teleta]|eukprot:ELT88915.1 hypothetical protein CAPTEDRAFT_149919 [Capitella teleta]